MRLPKLIQKKLAKMPPISYTPDYRHITYPNSPLKSQGVDMSFCFIVSILAASPASYIADLAHQASPAGLKTTPFCGCEACSRPAGLKTTPFCGWEVCSRPAGLKTTPFCGWERQNRPLCHIVYVSSNDVVIRCGGMDFFAKRGINVEKVLCD